MQQPWSLSLSPCFQCSQQRSTSMRTSSRKLLSRRCSASVCLTIHLLLNTPTSTASLPIRTPVFSPCWLRLVFFHIFVSSQPRTQDQEGLVVSSPSGRWTRVPNCPGLLVVNTGELLRHRYYIYQYLSKTFFIIFVTSAQAVGQRLCLLNTSLCCQPLKAVKVQVIHWSDHNLALQVQPALLLQLLPNSRDEVPANVHIRVKTSPLSPHLLSAVPGGGAGGVSFHNMLEHSWIHSITHTGRILNSSAFQ